MVEWWWCAGCASYLLFLVEALLVTVWYAETSGVENVCNLEAAQNALNLSPTGTLKMEGTIISGYALSPLRACG